MVFIYRATICATVEITERGNNVNLSKPFKILPRFELFSET